METVIRALKRLRTPVIQDEFKLHRMIKLELAADGIDYLYEYKAAARNRIDFLTFPSGIAIEVKKGKPNEQAVLRQIERYLKFDEVKGLILVIERYMDLPEEINGKPVRSIGLRKLWGLAN